MKTKPESRDFNEINVDIDDLGLTDEEVDNVKGGSRGGDDGGGGGMGGDWVLNHNETTVSDKEDEAQLADLSLADEELDGIKGGKTVKLPFIKRGSTP